MLKAGARTAKKSHPVCFGSKAEIFAFIEANRQQHEVAQALVARSVEMAGLLVGGQFKSPAMARSGRKAHQLDVKAQT